MQQKGLERDRVGKYAQYFQGNIILPLPEIATVLEPWILSLVITDLKTRGSKKTRLKNSSLQLAFYANISVDAVLQYEMSCCQQRSRLPKLQGAISWQNSSCSNQNTWEPGESRSQFVMSRRSLKGKSWLHSSAPMAALRMYHNCSLLNGQVMVTMGSRFVWLGKTSKPSQIPYLAGGGKGRRPHCWNCKQTGRIVQTCLQKNTKTTDTTREGPLKEAMIEATNPAPEPENPSISENGWTQVIWIKKKGDRVRV